MAESKARSLLRDLAATGSLPGLPPGLDPLTVLAVAREQGMTGVLAAAVDRGPAEWAGALAEPLAAERRGLLVTTLGQIALCARVGRLLQAHGIRTLPLKGAVLAETAYDVESDRPMSDVDLLALERFGEAVSILRQAGFAEVARGDHAWAGRNPDGGGILELHRSVVSAPGLFPLDPDGLWARSRPGRSQLARWPSPEDLLVQLSLHAAFQHGLALSLVQWLDFRRLIEREPLDATRLRSVATDARAEAALAAALAVAQAVVAVPIPAALQSWLAGRLPRGLARWLDDRLATPLAFVGPEATPALERVRWELLAGRRPALLWRTVYSPETATGDRRPLARLLATVPRALRLAGRLRQPRPSVEPPGSVHDLGDPRALSSSAESSPRGEDAEVPFAEEVLRECLASFPHVRLTVSGRCMEPALVHGERIRLVGSTWRRPRLGDVVLARQRDGLRLHRLVWGPPLAPTRSPWRTRADRGLLLDPPLAATDVLATVAVVEGRPSARPRRAGRALISLARGLAARLRRGRHATPAGATT